MGLWTFLEGLLLVANAFAILNEERFLAPKGLTLANLSGGRRTSLKGQFLGLIYSCQSMRLLPLILLDIVTIIGKACLWLMKEARQNMHRDFAAPC